MNQQRMLDVFLGSLNDAKLRATIEGFKMYEPVLAKQELVHPDHWSVNAIAVASNVSSQPVGLGEIVKGSTNRALNAWNFSPKGDVRRKLTIGLESGLFNLDRGFETAYFDLCSCTIYDGGPQVFIGMSSVFEVPMDIIHHLRANPKKDMVEAVNDIGFANDPDIGKKAGIVAMLTNERVTRQSQCKEAVVNALGRYLNRHLYQRNDFFKVTPRDE